MDEDNDIDYYSDYDYGTGNDWAIFDMLNINFCSDPLWVCEPLWNYATTIFITFAIFRALSKRITAQIPHHRCRSSCATFPHLPLVSNIQSYRWFLCFSFCSVFLSFWCKLDDGKNTTTAFLLTPLNGTIWLPWYMLVKAKFKAYFLNIVKII